MLAIESSDLANLPKTPVFRWLVHHIREIFVALLPKEFELDGSSKIQITCGPKGNAPQYEQILGTSNFYDERFNFSKYFASEQPQRDLMILATIEDVLIRIAELHKREALVGPIIRKICESMRERDFSLNIHITGLSKMTPCRKFRINVFRYLNRTDSEGWFLEATKDDGSILHKEWMTKKPNHLNLTDFYKKSAWADKSLFFRNRLGKVVFQFDASPWIT